MALSTTAATAASPTAETIAFRRSELVIRLPPWFQHCVICAAMPSCRSKERSVFEFVKAGSSR